VSNKNLKKNLTLAMVVAMTVTNVPFNVLSVKAETITENGGFDNRNNAKDPLRVSDEEGAINIYFNKTAMTEYAYPGNEANQSVNLEEQLIKRINSATESIDIATYEINLPNLVDALMDKASEGVQVRMVADAKPDGGAEEDDGRYDTMRLYIEKLMRGHDNIVGTDDDVHILADSPIFAVTDARERQAMGLPATADDIEEKTLKISTKEVTGHLVADGEVKTTSAGGYYSPADQMHNKFVIIDNSWVSTGTWNYTITGVYGTEENMEKNILDGNQNHSVEIKSSELASIYKTEFEEMYGSSTENPDIKKSNFHSRKTDNTQKSLYIGGKLVEVYFSPGDGALKKLTDTVKDHADERVFFTIFSWSDQGLTDELKYKWEGSYEDQVGELTGFEIKGLFDKSFTSQYWSANIDMWGKTMTGSKNNPNTRWANPAPVYKDKEVRKLHSKTMLIDADTNSDPTVVVGSTNWSANGDGTNDENMLYIHDKEITNQFVQEFYARQKQAGVPEHLMVDEVNALERAKLLVPIAEKSMKQADVDKANEALAIVSEAKRGDLAERLQVVQEEINYQKQLASVTTFVEKAESTQSGEDVYLASLLVEKLRETDKDVLTDRLDAIVVTNHYNTAIQLKHAEKEVYLAEKVGNDTHIRKAQERVNALYLSAERTQLVERLNVVIHQQ
jgi:phosphatidylserine/phosphatidylglycerophosphate/cardiolipin synthase-like enzyme